MVLGLFLLLFETEVKFIQEECGLGLLLQSILSSLKVEK